MTTRRRSFVLAAFGLVAGCASHVQPYQARKRSFDAGEMAPAPRAQGASLYADGSRGLVEDDRAGRLGDVVVIRIDEVDEASHDASTKLDSKGSSSYGLSGLLMTLQKERPDVDLSKIFGHDSQSSFAGNGSVARKGRLSAQLPVRVRRLLANGDLFVEGTKVVLVGSEEHHLYVSGIVRAVDIRADGSVSSSQVADAEIEYTGQGDVSDQQRPGWLSRFIRKLWPF